MSSIVEMFSYTFMVRAFIVGILISLCASLIGVSLVLRKNSMIGDGLSHVGFGAFAIATVVGIAPLEFALPVVIISSFLLKVRPYLLRNEKKVVSLHSNLYIKVFRNGKNHCISKPKRRRGQDYHNHQPGRLASHTREKRTGGRCRPAGQCLERTGR